jgi:hypothetical protein
MLAASRKGASRRVKELMTVAVGPLPWALATAMLVNSRAITSKSVQLRRVVFITIILPECVLQNSGMA